MTARTDARRGGGERALTGEIHVYGTDWCGLTYRVREYLMHARLAYGYFDIDHDPDAHDIMLSLAEGRCSFPLVIVEGRVLIDPTTGELQRLFNEHNIHPQPRVHPTDQRTNQGRCPSPVSRSSMGDQGQRR